ncbi:hypothetical protein F7725_025381 [Dissostichus mawsoni]|uniref:Uncharacterized protein n=1 Tax=Dissostichus mawsoni TaxID=36200 RepID=A0A7J5XC60_DISMA|nr:hypothetical protein F7725_025381 [Dissostichus mawsoni]
MSRARELLCLRRWSGGPKPGIQSLRERAGWSRCAEMHGGTQTSSDHLLMLAQKVSLMRQGVLDSGGIRSSGQGVTPEVERRSEAGDPEFARASRLEQVCGDAQRNTDEVSRGSRVDESEQAGAVV